MKLLSEKEMIHQFLTFLVTLCFLTFVLKKKKKDYNGTLHQYRLRTLYPFN